jgi:hypothetical protein
MTLNQLPYGTVIKYKEKLYFKSKGLDGDILTDTNGDWFFIKGSYDGHWSVIDWKSFKIMYSPKPIKIYENKTRIRK